MLKERGPYWGNSVKSVEAILQCMCVVSVAEVYVVNVLFMTAGFAVTASEEGNKSMLSMTTKPLQPSLSL